MFSKGQGQDQQLQLLKGRLGSWMYGVLTTCSREEFIHLLKTMKTNPLLEDFKVKVQSAKKAFKAISDLCTAKQITIASKPFFYGIQFVDCLELTAADYIGKRKVYVQYDIDSFNQQKCEVEEKIPNQKEFGMFANVIADTLTRSEMCAQVAQNISKEQEIVQNALLVQKEALEEIKRQKEEKSKKAEELKQEAQKRIDDMLNILSDTESTVSTKRRKLLPQTKLEKAKEASQIQQEVVLEAIKETFNPKDKAIEEVKRTLRKSVK